MHYSNSVTKEDCIEAKTKAEKLPTVYFCIIVLLASQSIASRAGIFLPVKSTH